MEKNIKDKECIIKLIKMFFEYKKIIVKIFFCMICSSGVSMVIPLINKYIMDEGFLKKDITFLCKLVLILLFVYILGAIIEIVKEQERVALSAKFTTNLNLNFYKHLLSIKEEFLQNRNASEIIAQAEIDASMIASLTDEKIFYALTKLLSMIGGFIGLCIINVYLAIVVVTFIPIKLLIIKKMSEMREKKYSEYIDLNSKFSSWSGEMIEGLTEIRNYGLKRNKEKELLEYQKKINKTDCELNMINQYNGTFDGLLLNILQIAIYVLGSIFVVKKGLSVGSVFAFITYSAYVTEPVISVLNIKLSMSGIIPSARRYFAFQECEEEKDEGILIPNQTDVAFKFENVSFGYDNREILKNVSFEIHKGEKVAIVGENGVGKSTLIKLLMRFYSPAKGNILLNNVGINEYKLDAYREMFSVVSQNSYLFNDTILKNIMLDGEVDINKLDNVLKESGLLELVEKNTLEYVVGNNGIKLSGGQRQKIAIARAFYRDRDICVLDEPNASIDAKYENELEKLLIKQMQDKTLIMITHRLDILDRMDKIIFLKNDGTYSVGDYSELIKKDSEFSRLLSYNKM